MTVFIYIIVVNWKRTISTREEICFAAIPQVVQ